jgi:hypothetical protein
MRQTHRFDKSFGPVASFSGILIFIAGLIATYFGLTGLILVVLGAFIGFTDSSTTIDFENRRVRFTNNIFGIIKIGKWINLAKKMQVGIKRDNKVYRTYSRSNRTLDLKVHNKVLYLFDKNGNPLIPIRKLLKNENSNNEIEKISSKLEISRLT